MNDAGSMQPRARTSAAVLVAAIVVLGSLSVANYIGWLRLKPEVSAIAWIAEKADYDSHVVNIHRRAMARVHDRRPDSFLPIYDVRNPGFFLLVAELFVRAGATTPVPLEIASMFLFNVGALCFCFWVYVLFDDLITAAFGTAFLALSQFFLFFSGVTHTMPFEFVFFNLTLLFFVLYLRHDRPGFLVGSLIAMFMTCMNYWFYYMSSWIIMLGLWWQYRGRPSIRDVTMISAPPIAAAALTAIMVMSLFGGVKSGGLRLLDIFVARTIDARVPGGSWYPNQRFMTAEDWAHYPAKVVSRLEWAYSFDFYWFTAAAACTFLLLWFHKRGSVVSALVLVVGGFSWYYVMFQHTHIHHFVGQYCFMAICPTFGLIVSEIISRALEVPRHASAVRPALIHLLEKGSGKEIGGHSMVIEEAGSAVGHIAAAAVLLVIGLEMLRPFLVTTYGLLKETTALSRTVEAKYNQAIQDICQQRSTITLADLQTASKDWGFEWRPRLMAETNQMPKCPLH
jgi:hypothetical protein